MNTRTDRIWAVAVLLAVVTLALTAQVPEIKKAPEPKANEITLTKNEMNDLQSMAKKAAALDDDRTGLLEKLKIATKTEREGIATELQATLLARDRMESEYLIWLNNARKSHECPECQLAASGKALTKPETKTAPSVTKPPSPETKPIPGETIPPKKETKPIK